METVLEQQRRYHEERERIIETCVSEQLNNKNDQISQPQTHMEKLASQHRVKQLRERYVHVSGQLCELYRDKDSSRKDEIHAISAPNEFDEFYSRLKGTYLNLTRSGVSFPVSAEPRKVSRI